MTTPAAVEEAPDARTGERAHVLMWRLGMTQTEVGRRLSLDSTALGRKLRGIRPWYLREIVSLAEILSTSVAYLIGETDDPRPPVLPRLDSNQQPSD